MWHNITWLKNHNLIIPNLCHHHHHLCCCPFLTILSKLAKFRMREPMLRQEHIDQRTCVMYASCHTSTTHTFRNHVLDAFCPDLWVKIARSVEEDILYLMCKFGTQLLLHWHKNSVVRSCINPNWIIFLLNHMILRHQVHQITPNFAGI